MFSYTSGGGGVLNGEHLPNRENSSKLIKLFGIIKVSSV
jgi:hypothetical protein